jgi:ribokinase
MITVVGSVNMDLIARVHRLPGPGETVLGTSLLHAPGGKGANQAVAAARAGSEVAFVGRVGDDTAGAELRAGLRGAGVALDYLITDPSVPSGTALIAVDDDAENIIVVVPGANSRVTPADVDRARPAIESSRVLLLQLEILPETVTHAARIAHEAGAVVVLNPAPAVPLPMLDVRCIDILVPNADEVARMSGQGSPVEPAEAARLLIGAGVPRVVVTLGAQGSVIVTTDTEIDVPSFPARPVDTTGAGDAFVGNLAHALDAGESIEEAVRFASAAAALSVQRAGAQPSMPSGEETRALLMADTDR